MKKKSLKSLQMNKKIIVDFKVHKILGGDSSDVRVAASKSCPMSNNS
jgi:hypothetical protein